MVLFLLYGSLFRIMITESEKSIAEEGGLNDRITSLPKSVIDDILDRMPIRDAARTSILSRKWRYIFADCPYLVLNKEFFREIKRKRLSNQYNNDYVYIVDNILLHHFGPVLKFVLDLSELHWEKFVDVDKWLLFLSRKGVRELTLDNSTASAHKLPSYIFAFPELTYLKMSNFEFTPPPASDVFNKLTHLTLKDIIFASSDLKFPQLVLLDLRNCSGIHHLYVSAPLLQSLILHDNNGIILDHYMICKNLSFAHISLSNSIQYQRQGKKISLTELFGCWTILSVVHLDGWFLKYLSAGTVPERLPTTMKCLRQLKLFRISFNLDETACILCLLQSSLSLQKVEIWTRPVMCNDMEVLDYLEERCHMSQTIDGLQTTTLRHFKGSKPEVLFVKLLLACSPSLLRVSIEDDEELLPIERLRIAKELMQFSRASPKAEMIFQPFGTTRP